MCNSLKNKNDKFAKENKLSYPALVILGPVPRILWKQGINLVNKFVLLSNKYRLREDSRNKSENDWCWGRRLSVYSAATRNVIRRLYSPLEVPWRGIHNVIATAMSICKFFKYPSPDTNVSTSPAGGEVLKQVLLPQCAPDATGFLSDVYKRGTRAQKFLADGVQCGRSMIEMLGVLAIIAVLSVGGIAGYSKAMTKWKINKTIQQITLITHNIFTTYANQKTTDTLYSSDSSSIEILKTLGFISDDMIINNELKNLFGGDFELDITTETNMNKFLKYIDFGLYGIPKDACLALGTADWTHAFPSIIGIGLASDKNDAAMMQSECFAASYGNDLYYGSWIGICNPKLTEQLDDDEYKIPFPIPLNIVAEHCNCKDSNCYFGISIHL